MEIRLPVWYAHERGFPRFVDVVALGPRSAKGAVLVRMQHIVRGSDNCFRCGRNITNDASKLVGYGPDCCEAMGIQRPTLETAMQVLDALKAQYGGTFEAWMPGYLLERAATPEALEALPRFGGVAPAATVAVAPVAAPAKPQVASKPAVVREVTVDGETFHFRFSYDAAIKDAIKAAGGRWDGVRGDWGTPSHWTARVSPQSSAMVAGLVARYNFVASPEAMAKATGAAPAGAASHSLAETTDFQPRGSYLRTLRPYQRAGVQFLAEHVAPFKGVFNGDVMGLGKTPEAIVTLHHLQAYPAIIVTTASTKFNWRNEFQNWLGDQVTVAVLNGKASAPTREADVVIVNYDILDKWMDVLVDLKAKAIVFDESQKLKNADLGQDRETGEWRYKTQRVQAAATLAAKIPMRFMLSGTAVKNRPLELISQLDILGRLRDLGGRNQFKDKFCDPKVKVSKRGRPVIVGGRMLMDYAGASNTDELNRRMREGFYLRREREQVLTELPAKTRSHYEFSLDNRAEYDAAEDEVLEAVDSNVPGASLKKFTVLRQVAVRGMLSEIRDWMEDFFEQEEHLILFAWHNEVADMLAEAFNAPKIVGSTPLAKRQQIVDEFQAGKHKLLVANIQAGGEGITLTRSHHVAFVELAWTPADHEQAESRAHRFGQDQAVTCHYFNAPETIYDDVMTILRAKWSVTDQVNIGNLPDYGLSEVEAKRKVLESIRKRVARRRAQQEAAF